MIKLLRRHWQWRLERFYHRNRWHLVLDLSLLIIIIVLSTVVITLFSYHPRFSGLLDGKQPGEINLENPPLKLVFSVSHPNFELADGVELEINLDNSGDSALEDIAINLAATTPGFSLQGLKVMTDTSGLKIADQQLLLDSLPAKTAQKLKISVSFATKDESAKMVGWQAQSAYVYGGRTIKDAWALPDLKIRSKLTAKALAYYDSPQGDQLGVGPLPPVAGVPTTYWIFFELSSDGVFKDVAVSGKLPARVELTGQRSVLAGEFKYNTSTRRVLWQLEELKAEDNGYRVGFEVSFLPDKDQVGQIGSLLSAVKYYAQDKVTEEEVEGSLDDLDTDLAADKFNRGQGKVIKP